MLITKHRERISPNVEDRLSLSTFSLTATTTAKSSKWRTAVHTSGGGREGGREGGVYWVLQCSPK